MGWVSEIKTQGLMKPWLKDKSNKLNAKSIAAKLIPIIKDEITVHSTHLVS